MALLVVRTGNRGGITPFANIREMTDRATACRLSLSVLWKTGLMDQFKDFPITLTSPATNAAAVTPSDTTPLASVSRAIYVGQTGDISVEMLSGQIITFQNVQGGSILALRTLKIRQTGTTALGIVSMW